LVIRKREVRVIAHMDLDSAARSRLISMTAIGPFSWRWPEGIENYERGWVAVADVDGTSSMSATASGDATPSVGPASARSPGLKVSRSSKGLRRTTSPSPNLC